MLFAHGTKSGRSHFLAHLEQKLRVEAEPAASFRHARERGEVDRVLSLVVRSATPVPAPAFNGEVPWGAPRAPLAFVSRNHIAVPVDENGRGARVLTPL